jgi:UDP-N-acetylmuramoyl-L-alanyl-D-glutamate--2,6-diaminopimelate ligase
MKLEKILDGIKIKKIITGCAGLTSDAMKPSEVTGLAYDSRRVKPGDLFIALSGTALNGNAFINDAFKRGAVAAVSESVSVPNPLAEEKTYIEVADARAALARLAANFYGQASNKMTVIGVTGTNGKTTTSYLIDSALRHAGKKTGVIGTINYIIAGEKIPAPFTTPEAPEFQQLLARMLEAGTTHVISEVSSHAMAQKRADCTSFKAAVFTNLTRDHLDYHKTMGDYLLAKKRLFAELLSKDGTSVINIDDPAGRKLAGDLNNGKILSYSVENKTADLFAEKVHVSTKGLSFVLNYKTQKLELESPLIGVHNLYNLLAAFGAAVAVGIPAEESGKGICLLQSVPGRFERVPCAGEFLVIVDYAHTPDALERLILAARTVAKGKVITLFGCGGDRDRGKRPQMGRIATSLSDFCVITSDNPRTEKPRAIIEEILTGAAGRNYLAIEDRREGIHKAIDMAAPGDIVLLAGKGHEDYQIIGDRKYPMSDLKIAEDAIKGKR